MISGSSEGDGPALVGVPKSCFGRNETSKVNAI